MQLSEWIIGTNQILANAAQHLPPSYVMILLQRTQMDMLLRLQSGELTIEPQTGFGWKNGEFQIPYVPHEAQSPMTLNEWEAAAFPDADILEMNEKKAPVHPAFRHSEFGI